VIRILAIVAAFGCQNADKDHGAGIAAPASHAVVLRLAPDAIEVEGKHGKHTFKLEAAPSAAVVKPVIEMIKTEAGSGEGASVVIWGRYDAPEIYNALAGELSDIPTTICLRDGANC
jgi:hypothetical protein